MDSSRVTERVINSAGSKSTQYNSHYFLSEFEKATEKSQET